jgi:hypothetical protein
MDQENLRRSSTWLVLLVCFLQKLPPAEVSMHHPNTPN